MTDERRGGSRKGAGRKSNLQKEIETYAAANDMTVTDVVSSVKEGLLTTLQTVSGSLPFILNRMVKDALSGNDDMAKFLVAQFLKYATLESEMHKKSPMDALLETMKLTLQRAEHDGIIEGNVADPNGRSLESVEGSAE